MITNCKISSKPLRERSPELKERIRRERQAMNLAPWQFAPSEVDDGPNPWPKGTAGHTSWIQAQRWRRELREREAQKAPTSGRKASKKK